jgi:hypothetical protein
MPLNSLASVDAQRGDRHAIDEFVEWYGTALNGRIIYWHHHGR